jgi:hypothetical protein
MVNQSTGILFTDGRHKLDAAAVLSRFLGIDQMLNHHLCNDYQWAPVLFS